MKSRKYCKAEGLRPVDEGGVGKLMKHRHLGTMESLNWGEAGSTKRLIFLFLGVTTIID